MDPGRRHKRLFGQRLFIHSTENIMKMFMFVLVPLEPKFYGNDADGSNHSIVHTVGGVSGEQWA